MSQPIYDDQNIFAKILRGELPCNKVDECEHTLSFHDIQPQAPTYSGDPQGGLHKYDRFQ